MEVKHEILPRLISRTVTTLFSHAHDRYQPQDASFTSRYLVTSSIGLAYGLCHSKSDRDPQFHRSGLHLACSNHSVFDFHIRVGKIVIQMLLLEPIDLVESSSGEKKMFGIPYVC